MKQLSSTLYTNRLFYYCSLFFIACAAVIVVLFSKREGFILLNNYHNVALNIFFVNYTFLGDGIFALALAAFLFYRKQKKLALLILIAYASSGLTAQVMKNIIYAPRPRIYFEASQYIYHLDNFGNSGGGASSFPSGHTTSAFALATIAALWFRKNWLSFLLATAAALVGYSRIYLAQHFLVDVLSGAGIGVVSGTITFIMLYNNRLPALFKSVKRYRRKIWENTLQQSVLR